MNKEQLLKDKLEVLKKNIEAVGKEALKTKYASAYKKLLAEINDLSNAVIRETVMYLDLALVKEEVRPKFAEIFNSRYANVKAHLLNADYDAYMAEVREMAGAYASLWCDNVERSHKDGEPSIFEPFTLEEIGVKTA